MAKLFQKTIISLFIGIGVLFAFGASADTFGYGTMGSFSYKGDANARNRLQGGLYAGANGTVTSITVGIKEAESSTYYWRYAKFGLYKESNNSLDSYTGQVQYAYTATGWKTHNIISGGGITAINYWLIWWASNYWAVGYDSGGTNKSQSLTYNGFPNPWVPDVGYSSGKSSIYATYTPSGGGAVPVINRSQVIE